MLLLEDEPSDALLITEALDESKVIVECVSNERDFREALGRGVDLALCDFYLPGFTVLQALDMRDELCPEMPLIVVSGTLGDENAALLIKRGAQDFLLKDRLARLPTAINNALLAAKLAQEKHALEERYALAIAGARDAIWDWELHSDQLFLSHRWFEFLRLPHQSIGPSSVWFDQVYKDDLPRLQKAIEEHQSGETTHLELEYRVWDSTGTVRWILTRGRAVRGLNNEIIRMAGSHTDITQRKWNEQQLHRAAYEDPITGLPNKALFLDRVGRLLTPGRKRELGFALCLLGLDRFSRINDSLGHELGDRLICEVGGLLDANMRDGDTVARISGDTFGILLLDVDTGTRALRLAERLRKVIERPLFLAEHQMVPAASMGVVVANSSLQTIARDLMRDADIALHRAKSRGRQQCALFDDGMHANAVQRIKVESDIRQALERDEFELFFQPIVRLEDERVIHCEALVRWNHPQHGLTGPGHFIPVAEDSGLILQLGHWVLGEACRQAKRWNQAGLDDVSVSVNVSPRQFAAKNLVDLVGAALNDSKLKPKQLHLEITESVLMTSGRQIASVFSELQELGVLIALDDFGTGYSSLAYLQDFHFDTIKIDRRFVLGSKPSPIIPIVANLGRELNVPVVAEGVETLAQLASVRQAGVPLVQGYHYARPMPVDALYAFLKARRGAS
ncbi:MAG: EAL domain-containing protein [Proteobacteria bacterium]|nr:EAL domain-containing protein [Pseudomonadota bacterium]